MEVKELSELAVAVKELYDKKNIDAGESAWGVEQYVQGLVGDIGDLVKYTMAYNGYRAGENIEENLKHEVVDCFWSLLIIAHELNMDISEDFVMNMNKIQDRITKRDTNITNH